MGIYSLYWKVFLWKTKVKQFYYICFTHKLPEIYHFKQCYNIIQTKSILRFYLGNLLFNSFLHYFNCGVCLFVFRVTIMKDEKRKSKGVAFILFLERDSAHDAVHALNKTKVIS